ncbi:MAG: tripartite tricarboxylate transporter substrate binding protein [Burkholderiales bacterium]|nr:tripartite tricarboxylate transporter substrate binding protein [Burkholderiales bacterium]
MHPNTTTRGNNMPRRSRQPAIVWALCLAYGILAALTPALAADDFPSRPVRIITPAQPGGTTDFLARLLATHFTETWKQQAIVDNRGSASGINAAEITKNAAPDGYTLFIVYHQHTVNAAIQPKLPYHPVNDFTPISQMTEAGTLLVVNPAHPAKTLKEFVDWSRSTKEPINFGSAGIGSGGHMAGELYKLLAGVKAEHIPYKGTGPAIIDLIAGQYHFNFAGLTGALAQVKAGKLRAIAVSAPKRLKSLPDIPSVAEALPGFSVVGWYGLAAPARLPKPLLAKIHAQTVALVRSPEFVKRMTALGSELVGSEPEAFRQFMLADLDRWADLVKRSGMKFN